ncbi:hypothetical protein LB543_24360 [Mesorhizobium sp. ESP7-2]|uniref:hypothetical protein n=1 Tax=Mesorhizobium sp. ESP7-2 TaxID=2876622 RepID=UPI001CCD44C8|nr:hypothetical protein [Mesorhizobium sp. ESP7-2]MBZ9709845.1 hypothetical protein [Mesorhizobium sp. ESP7-2]
MQQVFYPGHAGQPCVGEYTIIIEKSDMLERADIVLVSRAGHGAAFLNGNFGRDCVVNRILANDLNGIRLDRIRLFVLVEKAVDVPSPMPPFRGLEIKDILLDTDDYIAKGNPGTVRRRNFLSRLFTGISDRISYWSGHVVGGCARFSTSLKMARRLDQPEIETLCARIGLVRPQHAPPISPDNGLDRLSPRNTLSSSSYH